MNICSERKPVVPHKRNSEGNLFGWLVGRAGELGRGHVHLGPAVEDCKSTLEDHLLYLDVFFDPGGLKKCQSKLLVNLDQSLESSGKNRGKAWAFD